MPDGDWDIGEDSSVDAEDAVWGEPDAAMLRRAHALERLQLAREALLADGYFRPDEVGDDIAPRIIERLAAERSRLFVAVRHGIPLDKPWRGEALDLIAGIWAVDALDGP